MALDLGSQMTHTVSFKCIGTTKETQYQESLKRIAQLRDRLVNFSSLATAHARYIKCFDPLLGQYSED